MFPKAYIPPIHPSSFFKKPSSSERRNKKTTTTTLLEEAHETTRLRYYCHFHNRRELHLRLPGHPREEKKSANKVMKDR
jgi:hypothetical protein